MSLVAMAVTARSELNPHSDIDFMLLQAPRRVSPGFSTS